MYRPSAFLAILLAVSVVAPLSAQNYWNTTSKLDALTGDIKLLTLFVETAGSTVWEPGELLHYQSELGLAKEWLTSEAMAYGQKITFDRGELLRDDNSVIRLANNPRTYNYRTLADEVLRELTYRDQQDFFRYNQLDWSSDKVKILLLVQSNDRSHAVKFSSNEMIDLAIVYCRNTYGLRTDQFVIAHEILHQFGAWDLYYEISQTRESAAAALERWPHDVMISTHKNKGQLIVDELTAWRIGWAPYDADFQQFDPQLNRIKNQEEAEWGIDPNKRVYKFGTGSKRKDRAESDGQSEAADSLEEQRRAVLEERARRKAARQARKAGG